MSIPTQARIIEVYNGTWVADTTAADVPTGSFEMGERTWSGTVIPAGYIQDGSKYHARIVGGKGKLGAALPEKNYLGSVPMARIASDIVAACGESPGVIDAPQRVSYYERQSGTAGECLRTICDAGGLTWWVDRDGKVNVASNRPTIAAIDPSKTPQIGADVDGGVTLNVVNADDVSPGMLAGGKIARAIYWRLTSGSLIAECSPVQARLPDTRGQAFYLKTYSAKVIKQSADGSSVDVVADGRFQLSAVPFFPGTPANVLIKPGEQVTVGFLGGSPSSPYAMPATRASDAARAVALLNDTVPIVLPPMAFTGTVGGAPAAGVLQPLVGQTFGSIQGPGSTRVKLD